MDNLNLSAMSNAKLKMRGLSLRALGDDDALAEAALLFREAARRELRELDSATDDYDRADILIEACAMLVAARALDDAEDLYRRILAIPLDRPLDLSKLNPKLDALRRELRPERGDIATEGRQ